MATTDKPAPGVDTSYEEFFAEVLTGLGIQPTQANLYALADVAHYEGLNTYFNPLNAVIKEPGSSLLPGNKSGVQEYTSFAQGVQGTDALLTGNPVWAPVVAALKDGSEGQIISAFDTAYGSWGSKGPGTYDLNTLAQILDGQVSQGKAIGNPSGPGGALGKVGSVLGLSPGSTPVGIQAANGVVNSVESVTDLAKDVGSIINDVYSNVTSADFWIRVGFIVLGLFVLLIAIDKLTDGGISGTSGGSTGGTTDVIVDNIGSTTQSTGQAAQSAGRKATRVNRRYGRSNHTQHPGETSPGTGKHRAAGKVAKVAVAE